MKVLLDIGKIMTTDKHIYSDEINIKVLTITEGLSWGIFYPYNNEFKLDGYFNLESLEELIDKAKEYAGALRQGEIR